MQWRVDLYRKTPRGMWTGDYKAVTVEADSRVDAIDQASGSLFGTHWHAAYAEPQQDTPPAETDDGELSY